MTDTTANAAADTAATAREIEFVRDYKVGVARLWRAVTDPAEVVQWFGPEGVRLERCDMDLGRRGPWTCVMVGRESGDRFVVSGQVTHVRPPEDGGEGSVGFTWAWHDDEDRRGAESHVIFEVAPQGEGARFRLVHRNLESLESAQNHSRGWLSTLRCLDAHLAG
jgi:uncharacterized protein YndB with AHSA1/START domain